MVWYLVGFCFGMLEKVNQCSKFFHTLEEAVVNTVLGCVDFHLDRLLHSLFQVSLEGFDCGGCGSCECLESVQLHYTLGSFELERHTGGAGDEFIVFESGKVVGLLPFSLLQLVEFS